MFSHGRLDTGGYYRRSSPAAVAQRAQLGGSLTRHFGSLDAGLYLAIECDSGFTCRTLQNHERTGLAGSGGRCAAFSGAGRHRQQHPAASGYSIRLDGARVGAGA